MFHFTFHDFVNVHQSALFLFFYFICIKCQRTQQHSSKPVGRLSSQAIRPICPFMHRPLHPPILQSFLFKFFFLNKISVELCQDKLFFLSKWNEKSFRRRRCKYFIQISSSGHLKSLGRTQQLLVLYTHTCDWMDRNDWQNGPVVCADWRKSEPIHCNWKKQHPIYFPHIYIYLVFSPILDSKQLCNDKIQSI